VIGITNDSQTQQVLQVAWIRENMLQCPGVHCDLWTLISVINSCQRKMPTIKHYVYVEV